MAKKPNKTELASQFAPLDKIEKLQPRIKKRSGKRYIAAGARPDQVSEAMDKLSKVSEVAALAFKFGCPVEWIETVAKTSPNFGQFSMRIRNKIRGIATRLKVAESEGIKVKLEDVFDPGDFRKLLRGVEIGEKPAQKKTAPKPAQKKTTKKVKKAETPVKTTKKAVKKTVKKAVKKTA